MITNQQVFEHMQKHGVFFSIQANMDLAGEPDSNGSEVCTVEMDGSFYTIQTGPETERQIVARPDEECEVMSDEDVEWVKELRTIIDSRAKGSRSIDLII